MRTFLLLFLLTGLRPAEAASSAAPARVEKHSPESFDRVISENALFFSLLATFSTTAAISGPAWQVPIKNINVNLITRLVHDSRGKQLVRVRVAGVVRKNNNVCTTDTCDPAIGCMNTPVFCNDCNTCTDDSCDPATGCVFTDNGTCGPGGGGLTPVPR